MGKRAFLLLAALAIGGLFLWRLMPRQAASAASTPAFMAVQELPGGARLTSAAVGHEYRQDDYPAIAASPDGSLWIAWLSFDGDHDNIAIRRYRNGKWGVLHWVPATSGDNWLPQIFVDQKNRARVVWSEGRDGNWDLYSRWFDADAQTWGPLEQLTTNPLPDINPRLWSDGKGKAALVWQSFRGRHSNIFLKNFAGETWSPEVRITNRAANDWEPAVAVDSKGTAWVAYDSYKNGNYDVFVTRVRRGSDIEGQEMPAATSARMEAKATIAVDRSDRVWVAWEAGEPNWGKDTAALLPNAAGVRLGLFREPRIRCYVNGEWREPRASLADALPGSMTYAPHVFDDGRGSIWVAALRHEVSGEPVRMGSRMGYYEYWLTHFEGDRWSKAFPLPNSKGRLSRRVSAVAGADGELWAAWDTDNRIAGYYHRPRRQQIYAGLLSNIPTARSEAAWNTSAAENVAAKPGHPDEPGDIRAMRAYSITSGGKQLHLLRGDFHRHTEFSWDGGGAGDGSLQDLYRYMYDVAGLDFGASTDHQGGGFPYWWWCSQKMTDMYHVPGAYVPIFGYERSAGYPHSHRNIFFAKRSDSRVTPFFMRDGVRDYELPVGPKGDEEEVSEGGLVTDDTRLLWEEVKMRNGMTIPHTTGTTGGTDWRDNDPSVEPVVEIYQGARSSYETPGGPNVLTEKDWAKFAQRRRLNLTPEQIKEDMKRMDAGMVTAAWAKGYLLGVIASSDHGSTHVSYAMVYTEHPTREGILEAIRKRHTYGAMDNIILDVRMGDAMMGDEFRLSKPQSIVVKARGTRAVKKVDVIKDGKVIYSVEPGTQDVNFQYADKDTARASRHYYYVRLMQEDGMLAWSSPLFVN